jgi:hypothetical protein
MSASKPSFWVPLAIVAGAGLLLWSDAKQKSSADSILENKFEDNVERYIQATKDLAPALDAETVIDAYFKGDLREQAFVMTWLAKRATSKSKYTRVSDGTTASQEQANAASMAAANLAIDFRDRFFQRDALYGERANKVLSAVKLESEGKKSLRDISDAIIALVVNMQESGSASTEISKPETLLVNFTPTVTAIVNTSPVFYLDGYDSDMGSPRSSYLAKIVDRQNTPYAGEYLIITAPKPKNPV